MSVVTPVSVASPQQTGPRRRFPVAAMLWFAALLAALYLPVIGPMVVEWHTDDDMGHGFFVPLVVGYLIWMRRDDLLSTPVKPSRWGLALVVWGFIQSVLGFLGAESFIMRTGFLLALFGSVWALCGTAVMRKLTFPLILSLFALRIPAFLYSQVTFPLQIFASIVAEHTLTLLGIPVLRSGNVLELAEHRLSVVEACSGIRSLLSLAFLSLVYGFLMENRRWLQAALFVLTVPIAIATNAGRVAITGILYQYKPEYAEGFYHSLEGWVVFLVALALLFCMHRLLSWGASLAGAKRGKPA